MSKKYLRKYIQSLITAVIYEKTMTLDLNEINFTLNYNKLQKIYNKY